MIIPTPNSDQYQALGQSEAFLELQERVSRVARTDRPVIFIGERGTGKELAAARLHLLSGRWNQPYVTLNCASLTESLIESELFGHEAGAFTGAVRQRRGRFELASGGSLFLDEVATLPMTVQEKILRVVEYGRMERVGGSETLKVDVRLIAATNADLRRLAAEGRFRQDLLDRLSFEVIVLPPLRRRREDILLLADHFARRMAHELGFDFTPAFSEPARAALLAHAWPGNVRELKNVVERMVYRAAAPEIEEIVFDPFEDEDTPRVDEFGRGDQGEENLPEEKEARDQEKRNHHEFIPGKEMKEIDRDLNSLQALPLPEAVRRYEIARLRQALAEARYNQRRAAERLGLSYHQFRAYYRKYQSDLNPE